MRCSDGALPTLNSCTGMVRLEPVVTVPKPTVAIGFVARRCTRPVLTPVPLAGMVRVAWVGSLVVNCSSTKSSPVVVGANVI